MKDFFGFSSSGDSGYEGEEGHSEGIYFRMSGLIIHDQYLYFMVMWEGVVLKERKGKVRKG